jgi:hypothetical protein
MFDTRTANDEVFDEAFDTELIKARRPPYLTSSPSGLPSGEISTASMPAPKLWQRTSKKQVPCTLSVLPTERSNRGDIHDDCVPMGTTGESPSTDTDEWSRDFLVLVELNEH